MAEFSSIAQLAHSRPFHLLQIPPPVVPELDNFANLPAEIGQLEPHREAIEGAHSVSASTAHMLQQELARFAPYPQRKVTERL